MTDNQHPHNPLSRRQWIGAGVLLLTLVFIGVGITLADICNRQETDEQTVVLSTQKAAELQQSLQEKKRRTFYKRQPRDTVAISLHPFDPNTADSLELLQVGFRPWMAKNMLKYRAKGGTFRSKESLRKVYGMTDELYETLEPYITIVLAEDSLSVDSIDRPHYPVKKDTIIELNTADTTCLMYIRGIGRYTALQIIFYREQLGGFYSPSQLREIPTIAERTDSLIPHFIVDTTQIIPLEVNHTSVKQLQRHPYLSFTQAKALNEYRHQQFRLKNIDEIRNLSEFTDNDLRRLQPYLSFAP